MSNSILAAAGICKSFNSNIILDNINLELRSGSIYGLIGLNGAGKSTLVEVLSGALQPDSGQILFKGDPVHLKDPLSAINKGIETIRQANSLIDNLTVAQNIFIRNFMNKGQSRFSAKTEQYCEKIFEQYGIDINPAQDAASLSIGQKRLVQFISAVEAQPEVLLLDEPFLELSNAEIQKCLPILKKACENGTAALLITHRLGEILPVSDKIYIMREGEIISCIDKSEYDKNHILSMMTEGKIIFNYPKFPNRIGRTVLELKNVSTAKSLKNVSLQLRKGEILGIAGLLGSGRSTLIRCIYGIEKCTAGEIILDGGELKNTTPEKAVKQRISYIPSDTADGGIIKEFPYSSNLTLSNLKSVTGPLGFIQKKKENEAAEELSQKFVIKLNEFDQKLEFLSSGNQQKVVITKSIFSDSRILLMDDPTKTVDISTKVVIYNYMSKFALDGGSIIFISSDFQELIGMSDRIIVLRDGLMVANITTPTTIKDLINLC